MLNKDLLQNSSMEKKILSYDTNQQQSFSNRKTTNKPQIDNTLLDIDPQFDDSFHVFQNSKSWDKSYFGQIQQFKNSEVNNSKHELISKNKNGSKNNLSEKNQSDSILGIIIYKILTSCPIIQPNQTFKIVSDCWNSYWVIFRMFFTTIRLFFFFNKMRDSVDIVKSYTLLTINCSFLFDMYLSIHTGYYDRGVIILDRKKIALRYLKKNNFTQQVSDWWPLVKLIINVIGLAHIVGCIYFMLGLIQGQIMNDDDSWLVKSNLIDKAWFIQYLNSIYWSFSTMVSIMILLMTGIFGYVLNTIGMILSDIEKKTQQSKLDRQMLNRYMKKKKLPEKLKEKLSLYLDYIQSQKKERNDKEEIKVLSFMSDELQREVLQEINQENIKKFEQIYKNFSELTLNETLLMIKEDDFSQGANIFQQGVNQSESEKEEPCYIYLLSKGIVELYYEQSNGNQINSFVVSEVQVGEVFGNYEFFTGQSRFINARAKEASSVLKISRKQFMEVVSKNDQDYQKFNMLSHQLQFMKTSQYNQHKCYVCNEEGHFPTQCQKIFLVMEPKAVIYDYNNYQYQIKRQKFERNESFYRQYNSLGDQQHVQEIWEIYLMENYENEAQELISNYMKQQYIEMSMSIQLQQIQEENDDESMNTQQFNQIQQNQLGVQNSNMKFIKNSTLLGAQKQHLRQNIGQKSKNRLQNHHLNFNDPNHCEKSNMVFQSNIMYIPNSIEKKEGLQRSVYQHKIKGHNILGQSTIQGDKGRSIQRSKNNTSDFSSIINLDGQQQIDQQQDQQKKIQDEIDKQFQLARFDKLKNWNIFLTHNNFETIKQQNGMVQYFKQDIFHDGMDENNKDNFSNQIKKNDNSKNKSELRKKTLFLQGKNNGILRPSLSPKKIIK
ncbi:Zinc finger, CCHC-type [Pseudocohnilembus persalinus]|uniref:Zinc finger, CCHC-type n=1 Tax=Pseudocohnilembus persalinus TaxID=266149 RepID=A0A0V0Q9V8_PSEPJ|nr:Zinc finger, CCHC-type [Pseudocohnilembus persalinus]|eukprot:KRW99020.1 Zinc finger, CCHC-type [Pseudocohnilembus persalinus]